jgi:acyl-CoA thioesterase FadM
LRVADGITLARAQVRNACVDAGAFVPRRIPAEVAVLIEGHTNA